MSTNVEEGTVKPKKKKTDFKDFGCATATQCRQETWRALSKAREKGLIKEVCSNFKSGSNYF